MHHPPLRRLTAWLYTAMACCGCSGDIGIANPQGPLGPDATSDTTLAPQSGPGGQAGSASGEGGDQGGSVPSPSDQALAPARVRRLTTQELRNSLADILFDGQLAAVPAIREGSADGFDNQYDDLAVHLDFYSALQTLAEEVGEAVTARSAQLLNCEASGLRDRPCAERFAERYAGMLYRRPVTAEDVTHLLSVYDAVQEYGDHGEGVGAMAVAMVMSPHFLYRTELGARVEPDGQVELTSHERATLLSYFLWRTTPDETLRAAADADQLRNATAMREQVERMLRHPRARSTLRELVLSWLQIRPTQAAKDDASFTDEVAQAMLQETSDFIDARWEGGAGGFPSLWRDVTSTAPNALSEIYDLPPVAGNQVELDARERAGILTRPAFVASHTPRREFSPIHIGALVRRNVLCQQLPAPPDQIPEAPQDPDLSVREKYQAHKDNPGCAGCHELMDPLGFAFEVYDPIGRHITEDRGTPVSGEGRLAGTDVDGPFFGAAELSERLARSADVKACFVAAVLQFMSGRPTMVPSRRVSLDDELIQSTVQGAFASGDMEAVVVEMVLSTAFALRDGTALPPTPEAAP